MEEDRAHWDERHRAAAQVEPAPPEAIERWPELTALLPTAGRCLDLASGAGAVTLWLAQRGLEVTALDVSPVAIDRLRAAAVARGVDALVDARVVDLDDGVPVDLVDLDLIVCQRFRDPSLSPTIVGRLRRDGLAIVTVLSAVGADRPGRFHAAPGELATAFGSDGRCTVIDDHEGGGVAHVLVRRR